MNKPKRGYLISIGGNKYYEMNLEDELLIFETIEQIEQYCDTNGINLDTVVVHEVDLED